MEFLLILPVLLFSVVVHEVAHAQVARWEGDDTAYALGRITLNPIPHLDLMGSVIVPILFIFLPGDFLFGWAKPVPVNPGNFRVRKWGDIRVSLAGIVANFILAILFTLLVVAVLLLRDVTGNLGGAWGVIAQAAYYGVFINLILAIFNLIPIPPLDGSHVVFHLLPARLGARYRELGRYGLVVIILLVYVVPGAFEVALWPVRLLMTAADSFISLWM
ncbi:MAG: site-2 protease family protein [Gemmatimonadetes bacterium]|nr:site-2 protease family protein [Gemmatimonadota bacterium]